MTSPLVLCTVPVTHSWPVLPMVLILFLISYSFIYLFIDHVAHKSCSEVSVFPVSIQHSKIEKVE